MRAQTMPGARSRKYRCRVLRFSRTKRSSMRSRLIQVFAPAGARTNPSIFRRLSSVFSKSSPFKTAFANSKWRVSFRGDRCACERTGFESSSCGIAEELAGATGNTAERPVACGSLYGPLRIWPGPSLRPCRVDRVAERFAPTFRAYHARLAKASPAPGVTHGVPFGIGARRRRRPPEPPPTGLMFARITAHEVGHGIERRPGPWGCAPRSGPCHRAASPRGLRRTWAYCPNSELWRNGWART